MKKIIQLISILISSVAFAQTDGIKPCSTDSMFNIEMQNDPGLALRRQQLQDFTKQFIGPQQRVASATALYTIPVVFHVMHNYGTEDIPKQQILDAMVVLNESFQKLNSDTGDVIPFFQPIFADAQIQFRLANIDPQGNCTDGITRTRTSLTYSAGNNVKTLIDWPSDKYLNIWVVQHIASGAAGYAYYPGVSSNIDGVEILYDYVGGPQIGHYQSRSLTHEVGHYLNLPHTWGNSNSAGLASNCSIDDGIFDTPNCIGSTPSGCNLTQNTCGSGPSDSVDNVQNYMDYASCHKMFTEGQKAVMHAALNSSAGSRDNLWSQGNLLATGTEDGHVVTACVPKADFSNKPIYICEGGTVFFDDKSWRGDATAWQWNFPGGTPDTSSSQNPSVVYNTPGSYDVKLKVSNSAGVDSLIRSMLVTVLPDTGTNMIPYSEGFETIGIPGNDWSIENEGTSNAFAITSAAAASGSFSVRLLNQSGNSNGNVDALITPTINLLNVSGAVLTYKYAFAAKGVSDSSFFKVLASNDCGESWVQRLLKTSAALQTAPPTTGNFIPTVSQWATQTVSLAQSMFSGKPSVRIKFEFDQESGNNFYIDDINISGIVGINEILASEYEFGIHPNPTRSTASLKLELKENNFVKIELYDVVGKKVADITNNIYGAGKHQFEIQNKNYQGVYFVRVNIDDNTFTQKIVFVK